MTRIADFDYHLPRELVARYPLAPRDASRLLVLSRETGEIGHAGFRDLAAHLNEGDLLVVNDTRVFPARLQGVKESGGRVELLLHHLPRPEGNGREAARVRASHRGRLRPGQVLRCGPQLQAQVLSLPQPGVAELRLVAATEVLATVLAAGEVPLPPYLRRPAGEADRESYQTIFARETGAVACPTAGLHFTQEVFQELAHRGIETVTITLHVGPGTFLPVKEQDYTRHRMLPEYFELSEAAAARLNQAKARGQKITAVGTTCVRVLEHCASPSGFQARRGWCDLYIYPGYRFQAVDRLLTNFHLPQSTLLLLVSAFAGRDLVLRAYAEAVKEKYRFYSYGDCMLIL
ncbi:MAG: tRNA preQ1(34) S-adenosylmethionine ribosyltransferase-isomerase QueA [Desulfobaccales bacterium]